MKYRGKLSRLRKSDMQEIKTNADNYKQDKDQLFKANQRL